MKRRGRPALTPWFPGDVKPARDGVYQREPASGATIYARWNGRKWFLGANNLVDAAYLTQISTVQSVWPWRGRRYPS